MVQWGSAPYSISSVPGEYGSCILGCVAGKAYPLRLYKEERPLTRIFVKKRRTSPNLPMRRRSGYALRCRDCHHHEFCFISVAAILALTYGQGLRGDHWIHDRGDDRSCH